MTDETITFEVRVHWTKFGVSVAVLKTVLEESDVSTRRSELIARTFGSSEDLPEMLESASLSVLMMAAELPRTSQ